MQRYRHHGDKIVWRVIDCNSRRQDAGNIVDDHFVAHFKSVCDDILARLRNRPHMTAAEDSRAQRIALAELNRKNAEFWKGRTQ